MRLETGHLNLHGRMCNAMRNVAAPCNLVLVRFYY